MNKIVPFFEVGGIRYEINKTRWLIAEYDKLSEQSNLSNKDKENAIKMQSLVNDAQKYATKMQELWEIFSETFDDEDERKYLKVKSLYDKALEELTRFEIENNGASKLQKAGIDILEKVAIKGLAEQYFNMDEEKAKKIWCSHVEEIGNNKTIEWLNAMAECLFKEEEEEDNSFLSQMREQAKLKAENRKRGMMQAQRKR